MTMKGNNFLKFIQTCGYKILLVPHNFKFNFQGKKSLDVSTFSFNVLLTLEVLEAINCFLKGCTAVLFLISSQDELL